MVAHFLCPARTFVPPSISLHVLVQPEFSALMYVSFWWMLRYFHIYESYLSHYSNDLQQKEMYLLFLVLFLLCFCLSFYFPAFSPPFPLFSLQRGYLNSYVSILVYYHILILALKSPAFYSPRTLLGKGKSIHAEGSAKISVG